MDSVTWCIIIIYYSLYLFAAIPLVIIWLLFLVAAVFAYFTVFRQRFIVGPALPILQKANRHHQ